MTAAGLSLADFHPPIVWAIVGVLLLVIEILAVGGFFLSFATAAFVLCAGTGLNFAPQGWLGQAVVFAVVGTVLVPPMRWVIRRFLDRTPDINRY